MSIEDLQKQLYNKKDSQLADRPNMEQKIIGSAEDSIAQTASRQWEEEPEVNLLQVKRKRLIFRISSVLIAAGLICLVGWFWWQFSHSFDTSKISLEIFGQERIVSGEEMNYVIRYKNNTNVSLKDAVLIFYYPDQSLPSDQNTVEEPEGLASIKNLGEIKSGEEGQAEFKAKVFGNKDARQKFWAKLAYRPESISSNFKNEAEFSNLIISVPLVLSFDLPEKIVSGQNINFALRYINSSDAEFSDLKIKMNFPEGFAFAASFPSASDDGFWNISRVAKKQEGKIMITGSLSGEQGDEKFFKADLGIEKDNQFIVYAQANDSSIITVSPLYVEQELFDAGQTSADLGEILNYRVKYRNTTEIPIGFVSLKVKIESQAVDFSSITSQKGFFDSNQNSVIWNSSENPELKELKGKAEGEFSFSLRLKNQLPISRFSDKNFSVLTSAILDSSDDPLELAGTQLRGENKFAVKINSRVVFSMKGYYNDSLIKNSGIAPPQAGQRTTYTVYWRLLNISNDLSQIEVRASLPSYVQWTGATAPQGSDISYDWANHEVVWRVGKLSSATGILLPVKQAAFQISFIPSSSQIGQYAELVKPAKFEGEDDFTGKQVSIASESLATNLPDDPESGGMIR